jgi:plastocyanin
MAAILKVLAAGGLTALALLASPALAAEYTVTLQSMKFGPTPSGLHVGDVIVWQNNDFLRHTATARDGSFDIDLPPHTQAKLTLAKAGTIAFFCKFHPGMTGTLTVTQ